MKSKTETILIILNVLVWIVFIGLMVEAGAMVTSYFITLAKPEGAKNFYLGLDLLAMRNSSLWMYSVWVFFMVGVVVCKAYTAHIIIKILTEIKLTEPFKKEIAMLMERVSYCIVGIWNISILARVFKEVFMENTLRLEISTASGEYLFLAGIIFIFAQIFKKGIEIQSENELTV